MKYPGSKNRIAKHLLPIILKDRKLGQWYVEPFGGGLNMIDKVDGNRIVGEFNEYIVEMWKALISGWKPPVVDKQLYNDVKNNKDSFDMSLVGWVGICCSYSGKWFGGFAGVTITKNGVRDYQAEAFKNTMSQIDNLQCLNLFHCSYLYVPTPKRSKIYCDPPYKGTLGYKDKFDSDMFWHWCRFKVAMGHEVFISEYEAPNDFVCVWSQQVKSSLSANGNSGGSKVSVERLFIHKSQQGEKE